MFFKHLTLRVKNLDASVAFYTEMAKLSVSRRFTSGNAELAFLNNQDGETEIELLHIPGGQTFEGKGLFICFKCETLDETHALAKEKNLAPSDIYEPGDGTRYFYVYDPDGLSVQFRSFAG